MGKNKFSVAQQYEVIRPVKEPAIPVPLSAWRKYMERIEKCGDASHALDSFGWACIGFGGSGVLTAIALPFSVEFVRTGDHANITAIITEVALCTIAVASVIVGGVSLYHAQDKRKSQADLRKVIVEDMQLLADRHQPPAPAETPGDQLSPPAPAG
jgi:hypothetical protein